MNNNVLNKEYGLNKKFFDLTRSYSIFMRQGDARKVFINELIAIVLEDRKEQKELLFNKLTVENVIKEGLESLKKKH